MELNELSKQVFEHHVGTIESNLPEQKSYHSRFGEALLLSITSSDFKMLLSGKKIR